MAKIVEFDPVHVEFFAEFEDDFFHVRADAGIFVVEASGDGVFKGGMGDVLVGAADEPVGVVATELAVGWRVVGDIVVAVHAHRRQYVDLGLVELARDLGQGAAARGDQTVEVPLLPGVALVGKMGVPVPRALAHFRFVFVGLAVADAPRHRANGRTGIGVDHALFDRLRRYGTGHVAHDPAVVVADDFSIFACHRSLRVLGAEHCRLSEVKSLFNSSDSNSRKLAAALGIV